MEAIGENKGIDFDRFLLFHPQAEMTYIRQLSMSYGYYTALAVVDDNDRVTHVGVDNDFHIVAFKDLTGHDRDILGQVKCNRLQDDDLLSVYRINRVLKLKVPFKLHRSCRSMRYTQLDETYQIKKCILSTIEEEDTVEAVHNFDYYSQMYGEKVSIDLDNLDFDLEKDLAEIELQRFNDLKATGQTRLI